MSVVIRTRTGIEPTNDRWTYEGQGDPSLNGLSAGIGSIYVQMDSTPVPGDIWTKTGTADTAWTLQLNLPQSSAVLSADTLGALAGTSGTPSDTNRFVTDSDTRLIGGGSTGGLPGQFVSTANALTGDGSTDDGPALQTLANTTISGGGTIYYTPGKTYRVATATTLPKTVTNWMTQGALVTVDGVALTINGPIIAGLYQIFNCINGGVVQFSSTTDAAANTRVIAVPELYPEWWGAVGDGSNDDTAAINAALAASAGAPTVTTSTVRFAGPPVRLSAGTYKVTSPIHVTDVVGWRLIGGGMGNTTVRLTAGETGTATSGTATTIVNSGKSWTVGQWASGEWQVNIFAGTGAGQWRTITANDATSLTVATWTVNPDNTSQYAIAAKAVLDLDGAFTGEASSFYVNVSGYARHGIRYVRDSTISARGSSQGRLTNIRVDGNFVDSAWQFGDVDNTSPAGLQADLCTLVGCEAFGSKATSGALAFQVGFRFGDNAFANALNYTALGCESVGNQYGVVVAATNLVWHGGTIQSSAGADILLNNGLQGYSEFVGFRSESSAMLLDSTSTQSVAWSFKLADVQFQMNGFAGNRLLSWRFGAGSLVLENVRASAPAILTGTATSGTSTTLVNSAASFPTNTTTYIDQQTAVGMSGWDLQITAGTGKGQRRQITSNTGTSITVPAWTVTPDATSQYQIMPRCPVIVESVGSTHVSMNGVQLTATPLEQFVQTGPLGGSWDAELRGCSELDANTTTVLGSTAPYAGALYFTSGTRPASLGFGKAATTPDARIHRAGVGIVGIPSLRASTARVQAIGTTPTGLATSSGGSTTYNYKLVAADGQGNKALPSASFSVTNAPATLSPTATVHIDLTPTNATTETPAVAYDILKDDGTGTFKLLAGAVPWYLFQGSFRDVGQPLTTYTAPVADATGTLTVDGNATVGGTINSATVTTATIPTSSQLSGLTGGGDTSLHFHSADRARSNHTGTQSLSTIAGGTATGSGYTLPDLTVSGLLTANGGISGTLSQTSITANYTALTTDQIILADATAANVVVTLPAASSEGNRELFIKKIDASANTVRIAASGTDTIDGAASVTLSLQYAWIDIIADGTGKWNISSASTTAVSVAASSVTPGSFASGGYTFPSTLSITGNTTVSSSGLFTANGNAFFGQAILQKQFNAGNSGTALTLSSSNGNWQKTTLTGNCTLTITTPGNPWPLTLWLTQDATGSRTVTWPATVKWPGGTPPTLTTTASKTDIITLRWDTTSFWGEVVGQAY